MQKILGSDLKVGQVVTIKDYMGHLVTGFVSSVTNYMDRCRLTDKYANIQTQDGRNTTVYFKLTDEIIEAVLTEEEKIKLAASRLQFLPRTVASCGSDPEMFVVDKDNQVIPSFKFLKSKEEKDQTQQGQPIFWDGFQAEFNLKPDSCLAWVTDSAHLGLKALYKRAKDFNPEARLTMIPTVEVPPHMLTENKEEHVQFGCMPSKNVYGMEGKKEDGRNVLIRSAGGHIHLELNDNQKKKIPEYVKALDAILGVACVSMFGAYDDVRRREYYGLAGEYRTPPHGLEYRTLSNVWMCHPLIMNITYELARKVISMVDSNLFHLWKAEESDTISCINECNVALANTIILQNEYVFKKLLKGFCYTSDEKTLAVFNVIMHGLETIIDNPDDIEGNWNLKGTWVTHNEGEGRNINHMHQLKKYQEVLKLRT